MASITKTTLYLAESTHQKLKAAAVRTSRTMTELVEEGISLVIKRLDRKKTPQNHLPRRRELLWSRLERGLGEGKPKGPRDHNEIYDD